MTDGHKHRTVRVKRDGLVFRALRKPLWRTRDLARVDASPYPYGECERNDLMPHGSCYYLSALSILHRWTGLTLETVDE